MAQLQIVIPLWNEAKNIPDLLDMLEKSPLIREGTASCILVNNGSTDATAEILKRAQSERSWFEVHTLSVNQGYGGGVMAGLKHSRAPFLAIIPGDLQIVMSDTEKVWQSLLRSSYKETCIFKGRRTIRKDGWDMQWVSSIYTFIANLILGTQVKDFNGLPKIFHRRLLDLLSIEVVTTFVMDAQLLATAHHNGWRLVELPVTFHARRAGVSSWSGKRIRVYIHSLYLLFRLRRERLIFPSNLKLSQAIQSGTSDSHNS